MNHRRRCECGGAKSKGARACDRCAALDGRHPGEREVIATLRALGGAAMLPAIELETGLVERYLRRVLDRLRRLRRVGVFDADGERATYALRAAP